MFTLGGNSFPASPDELAAAITAGLARSFSAMPGRQAVVVDGGPLPELASLLINLDGATMFAAEPPPTPVTTERRAPGITVARFGVSARPVRYGRASIGLILSGTGLTFDFARDAKRRPLLVLTDAVDGNVEATIAAPDLRELLLSAASGLAGDQGITVQDLNVELESAGPRSLAVTVRVRAKKMMLGGAIAVTGRVDVDDALDARLSDLACAGEGMIGSAAAAIVGRKIQPFNDTAIPLTAFSLGAVKLRDLRVVAGGGLRVTAAFGRGA